LAFEGQKQIRGNAPGRTRLRQDAAQVAYCFAFGPWKYGFVRAYLASCGLQARFCLSARHARLRGIDRDARIVVWGVRDKPDVRALAAQLGLPIWRMEDGFLRSVGLGSDFNIPASLVLDRSGIYFDPNTPSDLEILLEHEPFSAEEIERAAKLRQSIVEAALSKYNFSGGSSLARPAGVERVILVPGQVEDDASIARGCSDIRTNLDLLREVRRQNPKAHVIFKPHPDLLAGNREQGMLALETARTLCDQLILNEPLPAVLRLADEVHTMTSLVGFEALLRGIQVHTYGRPFYTGWGLTRDRHLVARRSRKLTLDELVAGVLIRYPLYLNRESFEASTPEAVIAELVAELKKRPSSVQTPRWRRQLRKLSHALRGIVRGA
jgi:capsular polysaccharide export protein